MFVDHLQDGGHFPGPSDPAVVAALGGGGVPALHEPAGPLGAWWGLVGGAAVGDVQQRADRRAQQVQLLELVAGIPEPDRGGVGQFVAAGVLPAQAVAGAVADVVQDVAQG